MTARLFTTDGGEVVGFTGGDYNQYAIVRYGARLRSVSLDDIDFRVIDPDSYRRAEDEAFTRSRLNLTNAIGGPQTGRGVK